MIPPNAILVARTQTGGKVMASPNGKRYWLTSGCGVSDEISLAEAAKLAKEYCYD